MNRERILAVAKYQRMNEHFRMDKFFCEFHPSFPACNAGVAVWLYKNIIPSQMVYFGSLHYIDYWSSAQNILDLTDLESFYLFSEIDHDLPWWPSMVKKDRFLWSRHDAAEMLETFVKWKETEEICYDEPTDIYESAVFDAQQNIIGVRGSCYLSDSQSS